MQKIKALFSPFFVIALYFASLEASAQGLDIRVGSPLSANTSTVSYTASIARCDEVAKLRAGSAGSLTEYTSGSVRRSLDQPDACLIDFTLEGDARFQPFLEVTRASGAVETHTETFQHDDAEPQLALSSVGIASEAGSQQRVVVKVTASDDTDIAYLGFNLTGVRASDIRAAGGVLAEARNRAFARTSGTLRVYPEEDSQNEFSVSMPIEQALSSSAIASDAIILVDAFVVDSSGNQFALSEFASTGGQIQEAALALTVSNSALVINDPLQTPVIKPTVNFEFRGLVDLSGPGQGVKYESSHPDIVAVTSAGVVYPLKQSDGVLVTVTVSYADLQPIAIPVEVNFSKMLVGLELEAASADNLVVLEGLNEYHNLPTLVGVFDDGTRAPLSSTWTPLLSIPEGYAAILTKNVRSALRSSAAIPASSPAVLNLSLRELPAVTTTLRVAATDRAPEIVLDIPTKIEAPSELILKAKVKDDVGIARVRFSVDGAQVGERTAAPYEIALPLSEEMAGRTLTVVAQVSDTSGQQAQTQPRLLEITEKKAAQIPAYTFERPLDGQRLVEKSPLEMQITSLLGPLEDAKSRSGIEYVEFFFDGAKVGEAQFPVVEVREDSEGKTLFEVWRFKATLPSVSTTETSLSISAKVHAADDASESSPARLVRLLKNTPPEVRFVQPAPGASVTVGQSLPIAMEVSDDTMGLGTELELFANDAKLAGHRATNAAGNTASWVYTFKADPELLGETIDFKVKATDSFQKIAYSSVLKISVHGDQPPTVAIANPAEGASFVSGLPIPIRANAVDDLGVAKVDFFVNGQQVGTDHTAPFAFSYPTPENITREQQLQIHAVATDSGGAVASSQTVAVTLGQDEQPPVVNLASPAVTETQAGKDVARVVENSEFVLKVAGYDNVSATRVEVLGVRKIGSDYILTGQAADLLTAEDFPLQQIPGALNAYSALRLVKAPAFSRTENIPFDSYPVVVTVFDKVGNSSIVNAVIGVGPDSAPSVVSVSTDKPSYYPRDAVSSNLVAKDDRAVARLEIEYYLDGNLLTSAALDANSGLVAGEIVQINHALNLANHSLVNQAQSLAIRVTAYDAVGQASAMLEEVVRVLKDETAPQAAISSPGPGTQLFAGETVSVRWAAQDESGIGKIEVKNTSTGVLLATATPAKKGAEGSFQFQVPAETSQVVFAVNATDVFGNVAESVWSFDIGNDEAPKISVREPAAGLRTEEGRSLFVAALVTDDRKLSTVSFFVEQNGQREVVKQFAAAELATIETAGGYFSTTLRVPNSNGGAAVGIKATDTSGKTTEALVELDILDDGEAPGVSLATPDKDLKRYPGETVQVAGTASDNIYIDQVQAFVTTAAGIEIPLEWEVISRKDRTETITTPNPGTFGEIVVGSRFYADFTGRLRVPESFSEYAGQRLNLIIRVKDRGVNATDSPAVGLTIKADDIAPSIQIDSPASSVVERQPVDLAFTIADNIAVERYQVDIVDTETRTVLSSTAVAKKTVTVKDNSVIDLSRYIPLPATGSAFTIIVRAADSNGNETIANRQVTITPDQPAVVSLIGRSPDAKPIQGQQIFHKFEVKDDYVPPAMPLNFLAIATSIAGQGERSFRQTVSAERSPLLSFDYPEASGEEISLLINDKPVWSTRQGVAEAGALKAGPIDTVKLQVGAYPVSYQLNYKLDGLCQLPEEGSVSVSADALVATDGRLVLKDWVPVSVASIEIIPTIDAGVSSSLAALHISRFPIGGPLAGGGALTAPALDTLTLQLVDAQRESGQLSFLQLQPTDRLPALSNVLTRTLPISAINAEQTFALYAMAADRFALERPAASIAPLLTDVITLDLMGPEVSILAPVDGSQIVAGQVLSLDIFASDNSDFIRRLKLNDNQGEAASAQGRHNLDEYQLRYVVPMTMAGGLLDLSVIAEDASGRSSAAMVSLPVGQNLPPQLRISEFASYRVNGQFQKIINQADRLNYGEFWIRTGEDFRLTTTLSDDAGLKRFELARLARNGGRVVEQTKTWDTSCPALPVRTVPQHAATVAFNEVVPTEYEIVLEDQHGHITRRTFLVHPLGNVAPEIRITAPAENQQIVAGTFRIKVGVVATDDRALSMNTLQLFANGVKLERIKADVEAAGGTAVIEQAFDEIYDSLEKKYSVQVADEIGSASSEHAQQANFVFAVPSSLIKQDQFIELTAQIDDSEGVRGRDSVSFIGAADTINPEVAVVNPGIGFGPTENTDFTVDFRGYDNTKVTQLQLFSTYGVRTSAGAYQKKPYAGALRTVTSIPDADAAPVTTNNIDTPIYSQLVHVHRMGEIVALFDGVVPGDDTRYDVWLKIVAVDAQGNSRIKEVSYPVRADERPVIDIIEPLDGSKQVEGTQLYVNVNAYDDVGIASLRLVASKGADSTPIYTQTLKAGPFNFSIPLPALNPDSAQANRVKIYVEAIDTYGVTVGDLDRHRAEETISVEVVGDEPPVIGFGAPVNGHTTTEGEYLLVQLNANDDVGIDTVSLNIGNLVSGDKTLTDTSYPYEFLVQVPYGQAGKDLTLRASVLEKRFSGQARAIPAPDLVTVYVEKDTQPPEVVLVLPAAGGTVAEGRSLPFQFDVKDNVAHASSRVQLLVDKNLDGTFEEFEAVNQALLLSAPFSGNFTIQSISQYLGVSENLPDSLQILLRVVARDGAGNTTTVERPVMLVMNQAPQVTGIDLLDSQGIRLGADVTALAEGRGFVVSVRANDPEAGVGEVELYQALSADGQVEDSAYAAVKKDSAAPFQFHVEVPLGQVGKVLSFKARATDVDGKISAFSSARAVTIKKDQAPTAEITKPAGDSTVIIDGESIEVLVKASDDLGLSGIDRVEFMVNGRLTDTVYSSLGLTGQEDVYRSVIEPPQGVDGFAIQR